ncbi:MAG: hypothetical protein RIS79_3742 [Verrucomicrobiota bacterium]
MVSRIEQSQSAQPRDQPFFTLRDQIMLPKAQHPPAGFAQGLGHLGIAGLIAGDFGIPKLLAGLRPTKMFRAAVPKTAIDENGEPLSAKNEVRAHGLGT